MAAATTASSYSLAFLECAIELHNNNTKSNLPKKSLASLTASIMSVVAIPFSLIEGLARKTLSMALLIRGELNSTSRTGRFHAKLIATDNGQGILLYHIDLAVMASHAAWDVRNLNTELGDYQKVIDRSWVHIALNPKKPTA